MSDIQYIINRVFDRVRRDTQAIKIAEIEADPKSHKLTLIMGPKGAAYRYYVAGKDGRGWEVRFCYSCWRNAAGYFLGWREVIPPKGSKAKHSGKRDMWVARKVRKRVADIALHRRNAFRLARGAA